MREYEYLATEGTLAALERLRAAWAGYTIAADSVVVRLAAGGVVRIEVEEVRLEDGFTVSRIAARWSSPRGAGAARPATSGRDVLVFSAEDWLEPEGELPEGILGRRGAHQYSGRPGMRGSRAVAVCRRTDAVLLAGPDGGGILIRCRSTPAALEVAEDRPSILAFLAGRGYLG